MKFKIRCAAPIEVPGEIEFDSIDDLLTWVKTFNCDLVIQRPRSYEPSWVLLIYNDYIE